jgi:hypothetical protein
MSWESSMSYMETYRRDRGKGLNNEEPLRWFMSEAFTMSDLIDDVFSRQTENDAWETEYQNKGSSLKLQADSLKVSMMAGTVRDLRILFAAGKENRPKTAADHDRIEFMQNGFNLAKLDQLRNIILAMESL